MPEISVVLYTWNLARLSRIALYSVLTQPFPQDRYEIVFVDDGSRDENSIYDRHDGKKYDFAKENKRFTVKGVVKEVQEKFPDAEIRYLYRDAPGWMSPGWARNLGIRAAKGEIIVEMATDMVMIGPVLQRMWDEQQKSESVYVWAKKYTFGKSFTDRADHLTYQGRVDHLKNIAQEKHEETGYGALTWCYSCRKKWIEAIGGYDEVIKGQPIFCHVPTDTVFMTRLKKIGCRFVKLEDAAVAKLPHIYDMGEHREKDDFYFAQRHLVWQSLHESPTRANLGHEWGVDTTTHKESW